jgi:hypothetical protein
MSLSFCRLVFVLCTVQSHASSSNSLHVTHISHSPHQQQARNLAAQQQVKSTSTHILDALDEIAGDLKLLEPNRKANKKKTVNHNMFAVCKADSAWFIFLIALFGLSAAPVLYSFVCIPAVGLHTSNDKTKYAKSPTGLQRQVLPLPCQFLRVRRSYLNWKSEDFKPPPPSQGPRWCDWFRDTCGRETVPCVCFPHTSPCSAQSAQENCPGTCQAKLFLFMCARA